MSLYQTAGRVIAIEPEKDRVWFLLPAWRPLQPVSVPLSDVRLLPTRVGDWIAFQWNPRAQRPDDLYLSPIARCNTPGWEQFYLNQLRSTRAVRAVSARRGFGTTWEHRGMVLFRENP